MASEQVWHERILIEVTRIGEAADGDGRASVE